MEPAGWSKAEREHKDGTSQSSSWRASQCVSSRPAPQAGASGPATRASPAPRPRPRSLLLQRLPLRWAPPTVSPRAQALSEPYPRSLYLGVWTRGRLVLKARCFRRSVSLGCRSEKVGCLRRGRHPLLLRERFQVLRALPGVSLRCGWGF